MFADMLQGSKIYYLIGAALLLSACSDDVPTFEGPTPVSPVECVEGAPAVSPPDASAPDDASAATGDAGADASDMDATASPPSGSGSPAPSTGEPTGCSASEVCIQGRCHPRCTVDTDCSRAEMCDGSTGRCVTRTVPLPDAMVDASLPCEGVECADGLLCHPTAAECVQCTLGMTDSCDAVGFCDFGTGACVGPSPAACSPCDRNSDCPMGYSCNDRTGGSLGEKVCLQACPGADAGLCPAGMPCNEITGLCEPPVSSCTNWRLATSGATCEEDRDCFTLAAFPTGVVAGACLMEGDGGVSRCQIPCSAAMDGQCSDGQACSDDGFCVSAAP